MTRVHTVLLPLLAVATLAGCTQASTGDGPSSPRPTPVASSPVAPPTSDPATSRSAGSPTTPSSSAPPTGSAAANTSSAPAGPSSVTRLPPLSARARAAGLRDVRTIVPDAVVDLRYATPHNFTRVRLYPANARCLVHKSMGAGLLTAAERLRRNGYVLVFWDCYRPHYVQVKMFQIVPDPNWVARPGPYARSHEAGRSVDVTLARARTAPFCSMRPVQGHCLLRMGTGFDDFTPRAHAYATEGISTVAEANRARLRRAMAAGGLTVYSGEWWHFDGPGAGVGRPFLRAPLT